MYESPKDHDQVWRVVIAFAVLIVASWCFWARLLDASEGTCPPGTEHKIVRGLGGFPESACGPVAE